MQPNHVLAYINLASILQTQEDLDGAVDLYQKALEHALGMPELHCNSACLWQLQGKHVQAITGFKKTIELKPDFIWDRMTLVPRVPDTHIIGEDHIE